MLYILENAVLCDHAQTFTKMYDSKLHFCNRLKSEIPTKISEEAWAVMRQSAFHWSMPAKSFYIYVTITMKCCRCNISKDHRLFKNIFTNTVSANVSLLDSGLFWFFLSVVFFPVKADPHYWLQKSRCDPVLIPECLQIEPISISCFSSQGFPSSGTTSTKHSGSEWILWSNGALRWVSLRANAGLSCT